MDRFSLAIQFVIYLCVGHLKTIQTTLKDPALAPVAAAGEEAVKEDEATDDADSNLWSQEETERMLQFVAKV